jgi:cytochrome c biogenesis protein CcmG/thiol:disulfide interchange protein DsbE
LSASALWVLAEHQREATLPDDLEPDPASLVGSPVPAFDLPPVGDGKGVGLQDLAGAGGSVLLNFFASWCTPCQLEIPLLLTLRQKGVDIWGIAYRDQPKDTVAFLRAHGNPFQRVGHDDHGSTGPAFGLVGLPETFLIAADGTVRWGWAGGLNRHVVEQSLLPLLFPRSAG